MKDAEMWAEANPDQFVSDTEKKVFTQTDWPSSLEKRDCEGYIRFERVKSTDVFFNSRFESGNLRQVYKINRPTDYETIDVDKYLSELAEPMDRREAIKKLVAEKHEQEDIEEEREFKEWMKE
jgi:hypothetical protein